MATIRLPLDFKEFLRLLNLKGVEYLVVGGYAVNYHGYSRSTGHIDIWISTSPENRALVAETLRDFGFSDAAPELFEGNDKLVRLGVPPLRLEILTSISGVEFAECFGRRETSEVDGVVVPFLSLEDLKRNKSASGRAKDLADLEELT